MEKMGHVDPTQIKKNKRKRIRREERADGKGKHFNFNLIFFSLTSLFDLRKSDRQNSSGEESKCSTR